ncbi:protein fam107b [Plakobranchus ocellatus]|uniref:Protein fam107b n=1 Tax=Plakobranchus ocellatus TaxID=259542 RepID=A0AAV4A5R3_9GAST|nr:protein fam107b [Plakobranchus ocellatus]
MIQKKIIVPKLAANAYLADSKTAAFAGNLDYKMAAASSPTSPAHVTKLNVQNWKPRVKDESFSSPESPVPDYDDDVPRPTHPDLDDNHRNSVKFLNNFQNVITNIRTIEELYSNFPEPVPDYTNDDDEDTSSDRAHSSNHRQQQQRSPGWRKPRPANGVGASDDTSEDFPPPPPLTADEFASAVSEAYETQVQNGISPAAPDDQSDPRGSNDGPPQIKPKPLHNPCLESKERQGLHRELLLNFKIGKDVLQKPELNKVLRERRETQRKKEWEEQKNSKGRSSLEVKLEERRIKEEEVSKMKVIEEAEAPELLRMHKKITHKTAGEQS